MFQTIQKREVFAKQDVSKVFALYADADKHSEVTGAPVIFDKAAGGKFSAYGDYCLGTNLLVKENDVVVQEWFTNNWPENAPKSVVVLRFSKQGDDCVVELTHEGIPAGIYEMMLQGWDEFIFAKWQAYLG